MKRNKGVSLTEYGLIASTVAIVAVPALFRLGQELSNFTLSMIPEHRKAPVPVAMVPAKPFVPNPQVITPPPATHPVSTLPEAPLILSTSTLTSTVQTAGVNGTTELLANSLVTLANKLMEEGSIDGSAYNSIVDLANQGHALAQIEAAVETAAKAAGNGGGSAFDRTKATLNGKSYSGPDLVIMLNSDSPDIKVFRDLQSKVLNDASIQDPALKSVLSQLSNNILNLADASATSGDWISGDGGGINSYESFTSDIPDMIADYARKTTTNSNGICSTQSNTAACTR
ncbi:MAG: hypothetical protein K0Q50_2854 [Vampirovibrio sp.]|jgi:hypothetical protein|nr:hypothetical protein [Vampirovibrio sp.]